MKGGSAADNRNGEIPKTEIQGSTIGAINVVTFRNDAARLYYTLFLSPEVIIVCEFLRHPLGRSNVESRHFSFPRRHLVSHPFDNRHVFPSFAPSIPYLLFRFVTQSSTQTTTMKERTGSEHLHANCFWPSTISTGDCHPSFKPSDRIKIRTNS